MHCRCRSGFVDCKFDGLQWDYALYPPIVLIGVVTGWMLVTLPSIVRRIRPIVPYYAMVLALVATGWALTYNGCALENEFLRLWSLGLVLVCLVESERVLDPDSAKAKWGGFPDFFATVMVTGIGLVGLIMSYRVYSLDNV